MKNYSQLFASFANYTPAASTAYTRFVYDDDPGGHRNDDFHIHIKDLNFLNPQSDLIHFDTVLYSAGTALSNQRDCLITKRDKSATTVIGDSGGFQIIDDVLPWEGDLTRSQILNWLESHCDIAMTLDIPTRAIDSQKSEFKTFRQCLDTTLENLQYFQDHRSDGQVKFLNVLQGREQKEADQWYDAVKGYNFEGWAFAGSLRLNFRQVLRRIIKMRDEGYLDKTEHIHFLGTGRPDVGCVLTYIQNALEDSMGRLIPITYDSSSPFTQAYRYFSGYTFPKFSPKGFSVPTIKMPREARYYGSPSQFPFNSEVGRKITWGDLCVKNSTHQDNAWDNLSRALLVNHNIDVLMGAITTAHNLLDLYVVDAEQLCPSWLVVLKEAVPEILNSEQPDNLLSKYRQELTCISKDGEMEDGRE